MHIIVFQKKKKKEKVVNSEIVLVYSLFAQFASCGKSLELMYSRIILGHYITMYSPIVRSVLLKRRNQTILKLLGNVFIHIAARSKLFPQMAGPYEVRIVFP